MDNTNLGPIPCGTCGRPLSYSVKFKQHSKCWHCYKKKWYKDNKKRVRAVNQAYYNSHRSECSQQRKDWRKKNPERAAIIGWRKHLRQSFSSLEYYGRKFKEQKGLCAICGKVARRRRLCQDHDHERKIPRGLLCNMCNFLVGILETQGIDVVQKALTYLIGFKKGDENAS